MIRTDQCESLLKYLKKEGGCRVNDLHKKVRRADALTEASRHRLIDYDCNGCVSIYLEHDEESRQHLPAWDRILTDSLWLGGRFDIRSDLSQDRSTSVY